MSFVASRATKVEASATQGELYEPAVGFVLTGVMAAGKSTVAELLAQRFERGVHLRGDVFRKMIVAGRDPISPDLGEEAMRQLDLRQRLAASAANDYWRDDFNNETPHVGLWLNTSDQTPEETVEEILHRRYDARVR